VERIRDESFSLSVASSSNYPVAPGSTIGCDAVRRKRTSVTNHYHYLRARNPCTAEFIPAVLGRIPAVLGIYAAVLGIKFMPPFEREKSGFFDFFPKTAGIIGPKIGSCSRFPQF